ncbi:MAG TPA: type IV pili methyl-accepting chemotaxis transducer N-terminal domain-containing protein [Chitinophagaceae bacterium]|nr:type IV pili methyl-accepting chemotaxis transducer N-terminal domain-containing protein [Chitinophagaceae bacterium]
MPLQLLSPTDYKKTYRVFVVILLSMLLLSQAIIQFMITSSKYDGTIIQVAGQQGMLSQDIAKTALNIRLNLIQGRNNNLEAYNLKKLVTRFETNHYSLLLGNDSMGITANNSPEILRLFRALQPSFLAIEFSAKTIAFQSSFAEGMDDYIDNILVHEETFLNLMEGIVLGYNRENQQKIRNLQYIEILLAIATLVLVTLEIILLFTPLLRKLQERNRDLESQNARTRHFLYVISHGIRKPVANLLGLSDLLSSAPAGDRITVGHIRQSALELDQLIRELNENLQGAGEEGIS